MEFHYTVTTKKSIDEAISALEANLKEHKFGILWQLDLPSRIVAMSFCEPRSCRLQLSS